MKRNIRFVYNGEEIEITAEREGSSIRIERDSKEYVVALVQEPLPVRNTNFCGPSSAVPKKRHDPSDFSPAPETAAPGLKPGAGGVSAPMTGVVKEIMVAVGDSVKEGEKVMIMEAMKMDIEISAVRGGFVTAILVKPNDNIKEGQPLIRIG